ncbi:hypothetical protein AVEN_219411-1 [Araneus ventricosus]|uniref:Uncharacterized protein n=1 Tax=Araneus ventricosus TaxID=182803 RepID=A0A4Y2T6V9_ARAVE|nr:hypothetical protein AVEN_219411-1 [Araneus ventricosus]
MAKALDHPARSTIDHTLHSGSDARQCCKGRGPHHAETTWKNAQQRIRARRPTAAAILAEGRSDSFHLSDVRATSTARRCGLLRFLPVHLLKTVPGMHGFLFHEGSPAITRGSYVNDNHALLYDFPSPRCTLSVLKVCSR